ncbi:unnamed protein product [Heligmosomoides polygyrus]|uniref:Saposin B-type domain-containing protein n=1 Tax=Heligmosomoides polygyrus TaxID=6339 RepID=A0A183FQK9_HELPZ|nr:unnamed protein product [Heligmosomoides polygyrus]
MENETQENRQSSAFGVSESLAGVVGEDVLLVLSDTCCACGRLNIVFAHFPSIKYLCERFVDVALEQARYDRIRRRAQPLVLRATERCGAQLAMWEIC